MNTFVAGSCRAANASKTKQVGILLNDVLKIGCWLKEHTFKMFKSKDIINMDNRKMDYTNKLIS